MKYFIIILLITFIHIAYGQPKEQWVARYNSPGSLNDTVIDMEIDKLGNVYILGYNQAFITIKYNSSGVQEWVRNYKGPSQFQDVATDMVIDDSGNVYVTGTSLTNNQSPYHATAVLIKYSPQGDTLWTLRFETSDSIGCSGRNVLLADSGNIYLTAECSRIGESEDITALKISIDGQIIWDEYFSGPNGQNDDLRYSTTALNNNLYISGTAGLLPDPRTVLRYDVNGNLTMHIQDSLSIRKMVVDDQFNIFSGGDITRPSTMLDFFVGKYDSSGQTQWVSIYHHDSFLDDDLYRDFTIDEFGNSYITGSSAIGMELGRDIVTIKYDPNGDSIWVQRYDSIHNSSDHPQSIAVDNMGNVYVAGYTNFNLFANWYITICYDSTGSQKFSLFYNNGLPFHNHEAKIVKTDSLGNFYVTGVSHNSNADYDIATIKYSLVTDIKSFSNEIPIHSFLHQNYPNPFNPSTKIKFDLSSSGITELLIYNTLGKEVQHYDYNILREGSYEITLTLSNLPSGIYYYSLKHDNVIVDTKKLSLIK